MFSIEVAYEKAADVFSPSSPNELPGTVATFALSSRNMLVSKAFSFHEGRHARKA